MTVLKMTVDEAIALADQWCAGLTMDADSKGWGAILLVLAEEVRRLREKENSADMCLDAVHSARQCLSDHFGGNLAFLDDDLIRGVVKMHEELEAVYDLLPGHYYMDPPDGGDVPLLEQIRRMADDAARYRWLRNDDGLVVLPYDDYGIGPMYPSGSELDAAIDKAMEATNAG